MTTRLTLLSLLLLLPGMALSAEPTAESLLARYDALMGPPNFEATVTMMAHRDDGSQRSYRMRILKSGDEKVRLWFQEPAAVRGQEILRQGDNSWLYMPNLKRAVRMANRDSFQGGDFNNADVLRTNYGKDYTVQLVADPSMPEAALLELKAKTNDASYDRIKLWLNKTDGMPIKGEYYTSSGKLLRAAEFLEVKSFNGVKRPSKVKMRNMVATKRFSEMAWESLDTKVAPASGRFVLDDLGR